MKVRDCVGCGYCCRKAPCVAAVRLYGAAALKATEEFPCPALEWDGSRYWCRLCMLPGKLGEEYRRELAAGAGCCSGLNSDRQNIPPPKPKVDDVPQLPKELVAVLLAMGEELISSDALYLTMRRAERKLGRPGFAEYCLAVITGNRAKSTGDFMG